MTPLALAASFGYEEAVKLLLQKGADINSQDNSEQTLLELSLRGYGPRGGLQLYPYC